MNAGQRPYLAGFESSTGARSLLERIPAITYVCNANYLAENFYPSPQSEAMTGYSSEAFLEDAALWDRLVHEDDLGRMTQAWDQACAAGTPFRCEYRVITRDEREIWVRDEATFVLDEAGNLLYAQGLMLDVTEQRRNAELLARNASSSRSCWMRRIA